MKKIHIISSAFWLLTIHLLSAQPNVDAKRGNQWINGYVDIGYHILSGLNLMDFNGGSLEIDTLGYYDAQGTLNYEASNSLCDTAGRLWYYTSGVGVFGADYRLLPLSDGNNSTTLVNDVCGGTAYPEICGSFGATLLLPQPNSDKVLMIFQSVEYMTIGTYDRGVQGLQYSIIDTKLRNGLGDMTALNIDVVMDTLLGGALAICRHANGRDWWIIAPENNNYGYHTLLLDPSGIRYLGRYEFEGVNKMDYIGPVGKAVFTQQGDKMVRFISHLLTDSHYYLYLNDFDRNTGTFGTTTSALIPVTSPISTSFSLALSASGEYGYAVTGYAVFQFKNSASDLQSSVLKVADYDGFADVVNGFPFGTHFYAAALAPDNKIYITTSNGTRYLHVINRPDEAGLACDLRQHSIPLIKFQCQSMPNYPNFSLGPIDGSPSDTLGINNETNTVQPTVQDKQTFSIFPNPATDVVNLSWSDNTNGTYQIQVSDVMGRLVFVQDNIKGSQLSLNTNTWAAGFYTVTLIGNTTLIATEKIIIQH